jgi:hypothetical protein
MNKRKYVVVGLNTKTYNDDDCGTFPTIKKGEACIFKNIKKYSTSGMGMIEMAPLGKGFFRSRQWNYYLENGTVMRRENHGDLW